MSRRFSKQILFAAAWLALGAPSAQAAIKLNPQSVVDLTLKQGLEAKSAELEAQRGYLALQQALGAFDFQVTIKPTYEYTQAQTLAGIQNVQDRTLTWYGLISKKVRTGTTFDIEYTNTQQASILTTFATVGGVQRYPNAYLQSTQFQIRQNFWRNAFGYADRLALEIGRDTVVSANETRDEKLETVLLDSMTLFWNTYTADQQLKEAISAREKYEQLVRSVRRRSGFNLASPGELPRLEAEMLAADSRVKSASAGYLNAVDKLLSALQIATGEPISIEVPNVLPPVPQLKPKTVEELRVMKIADLDMKNAQKNLQRVRSNAHPQFDLVARARATGVDEARDVASAEMTAINYPTYYVGIEFTTPIDSDLLRGQIADAEVQYSQSETNRQIKRYQNQNALSDFERRVSSQYSVAKSSVEIVDFRTKVVAQLEAAYRQGRQPLVELIRAYNDLFSAQFDRARAVGDYHIILNQYAASRDELVMNVQ